MPARAPLAVEFRDACLEREEADVAGGRRRRRCRRGRADLRLQGLAAMLHRERRSSAMQSRPVLGRRPLQGLFRRCILRDPLQPDFSPPSIDASWAEHPVFTVARLAIDTIEDDRRRFHASDVASSLIDEFLDAGSNPEYLSAVGNHLGVKAHSAIVGSLVDRRQDFLVWPYSNEVARLKSEDQRSGHPCRRPGLHARLGKGTPPQSDWIRS